MFVRASELLDGDEFYTTFMEPFMTHASSGESRDWDAWAAKLPSPDGSATVAPERVHITEGLMHRGPLSITGGLEIHEGGILVVLGDLQVRGGVLAVGGYVGIVVRGALDVDRLYTNGDVIAFGGIQADIMWGVGNDYATYAPSLDAKTLVSEDRFDMVDRCTAAVTVDAPDIANHFADVDPDDMDSVCRSIGIVRQPIPNAESEPGERAELERKLLAGWESSERKERIRAMREVYAVIKRRRLADLGDLLAGMIERKSTAGDSWSIQDELHLLADLRRPDILQSLKPEWLGGHARWIPDLVARASEFSTT